MNILFFEKLISISHMKKIFFLLCLLTTCTSLLKSQGIPYSLSCKVVKSFHPVLPSEKTLDIGRSLIIKKLVLDEWGELFYYVESGNESFKISLRNLDNVSLDLPSSNVYLWQYIKIKSDLDVNLLKKGFQFDLRKDLDNETNDIIQNYNKYNLIFKDEFLVDYLQSLLYRIHLITHDDGRPGSLSIKVLIDNEPNAFCLPNGAIFINTGLLSTIRSEEELIAVIAHEVAHFELDHHVMNVNSAVQRQKRSEFWAGFATTLAAAADVYVSSNNEYYIPGIITMATATISSEIAASAIDRLGAKYSNNQETEADDAAILVLKFLNIDPKAMSSALSRTNNYSISTNKFYSQSGTGSFPILEKRIEKIGIGDPEKFKNVKFDRIVSFVNSYNSQLEFEQGNIETAKELCDRNILAGVPTEMDYLIKSMAIRLVANTQEEITEALNLLIKAETLNITPLNYVNKQEGITLLRLNRNKEAVDAFNQYLNGLLQEEPSEYIQDEVLWTRKMIAKALVL